MLTKIMFENLLNEIYGRNGLCDTKVQAQYLSELRPYAKQVWQSYKRQNVRMDYSEAKIQDAYLLRYFPFYTRLVEKELDALRTDGVTLPELELLDACFLGCGPGPELIGFMHHLRNAKAETTMLTAKMVDVASEAWSHSREIVRDFQAEPFWEPGLLEIQTIASSLSDTKAFGDMHLEGCHLAVIQNCLNEVSWEDHSKVVANIMDVFSQLSPGAIALVVERANYKKTEKMMKEMQQLARSSKRYERLTPIGDADLATKTIRCQDMLDCVPDIILDNLLIRSWGTIPTEWNGLVFMGKVEYICIAFQVDDLPTDNS